MVNQRKWYVVIVGTVPGVYPSWIEAGPKTRNIPGGAVYQSFPSRNEALRVFEAAKARGEVEAYPSAGKKDKASGKSTNAPLSPLGVEAALLRTPLDLSEDSDRESMLVGLQSPLSSSARSRVAKLRRTLRDPTDSYSTPPSPPTKVTQVYAPLYEEDDVPCNTPVARPSPHFTFTSSSSRAYPVVSDKYLLESGAGEMSFRLEVSDRDSPPPTPSSSTHPGAEEHISGAPRCMPLHPEPPSKSRGVTYRSLADLANMKTVDSRIWLPESRVFDPDKVKPRPLTRPSSPAKKDTSSVSCHKPVCDTPQLRSHILLADAPFVRADRGRYSKLTPSWSLPILPKRELEDNSASFMSQPAQLLALENHRAGTAKEIVDFPVRDKELAERSMGHCPSPRNHGRSHVQLVPRDGKDEQSAIMVHCPPNCPHETCYRRPPSESLSVPTVEPASSRYVDACVSPIIAITSRMQETDNPVQIRSKGHLPVGGDHPCELAEFTHVSHKGIAPETDVRSPIVKGTMVPVNAAE